MITSSYFSLPFQKAAMVNKSNTAAVPIVCSDSLVLSVVVRITMLVVLSSELRHPIHHADSIFSQLLVLLSEPLVVLFQRRHLRRKGARRRGEAEKFCRVQVSYQSIHPVQ